MDTELKKTHEDVVDAVRAALITAIKEFPTGGSAEDVLKLAQAYERIQSADVPY